MWYRNVYSQIASDVWETKNPVHKLTTDKPQLVLEKFLNTKISRSSVATRSRCGGIFTVRAKLRSVL